MTILTVGLLPCLGYIDKWIYLNKTVSMPQGLYIKVRKNNFSMGDIIVFKLKNKQTLLLKHIAGMSGDTFCLDFEKVLWVNNLPLAKQNIQKYYTEKPQQEWCNTLNSDEFLVLGEHQNSYDSRYFGPIKTTDIITQVEPFLIF